MGEPIYGLLEVLGKDSDLNYNVRLRIMRSGVNLNGWDYQNLEQYADTFKGTPILCAYLPGRVGDGHNMSETLWRGERIMDFTGPSAERIVGAIGEGEGDIWIEPDEAGTPWIIANGKLWRFYNRQLCDTIAEQGRMSVSAETEVAEEHEDENGISVFTAWRGLGVTILHNTVAPAIPGANIQALKAMSSEKWNELKLKVASYHPDTEGGQGTPPEDEPEPPKNNSEKGVKRTVTFTKKQLAKLNERFTGFVLLAARENEEDHSIVVKMRNDSYEPYSYRMEKADETIATERITAVNAMLDLGDEIQMDCNDYFVGLNATIDALTAAKTKAENELEQAKATIKAMEEKEKARRLSALKAAAKDALAKFNADRAECEKVCEEDIGCVMNEIDAGEYTECADKDGNWCGEAKVCQAVKAICADKETALRASNRQKKDNQYAWDGLHAAQGDDGSVGALLRSLNINE